MVGTKFWENIEIFLASRKWDFHCLSGWSQIPQNVKICFQPYRLTFSLRDKENKRIFISFLNNVQHFQVFFIRGLIDKPNNAFENQQFYAHPFFWVSKYMLNKLITKTAWKKLILRKIIV